MPAQSKNKGSDAQHQSDLEYRRANAPGGDGRRYSAKREQQEQDEGDYDEKPNQQSRQGRHQEKEGHGQKDLEYRRSHAPGGDGRRYSAKREEEQGDQDFEDQEHGSANFRRHQSEEEDDKAIVDEQTHEALSSIGKKAADARWHGEKAEITDEEREAMSKIGRKGGHSSGTGSAGHHGGPSEEQVRHNQEEDDKSIDEQTHEALSSIGKKAADARWHGEKAEISDEEREAMSKIGRKGGHSTGTGGQIKDEEQDDDIAAQKHANRQGGRKQKFVEGA